MKISFVSMTIRQYPISYFNYYFVFEFLCPIYHGLRYSCTEILKIFVYMLLILGVKIAVEIFISVNGFLKERERLSRKINIQ